MSQRSEKWYLKNLQIVLTVFLINNNFILIIDFLLFCVIIWKLQPDKHPVDMNVIKRPEPAKQTLDAKKELQRNMYAEVRR